MDQRETTRLLRQVAAGEIGVDHAVQLLRQAPFADLGFAKLDLHRGLRQGISEVVYGAGKTSEQIQKITAALLDAGQRTVLVTRLDAAAAGELRTTVEPEVSFEYFSDAHIAVVGLIPEPDGIGRVVVATGGTSDQPIAEEAAITAQALGNEVVRVYDVGVAGLHRLLAHTDDIMGASVIIALAGMEGALASVIAGLADCPVIAVPTSVGYGAAYEGLAALLSMLNSCASGVSVVNIDNGYGAGYLASMINHVGAAK
ncbi:nickel pincer cofactor biosynthesis protein LarB [Brooklawnia sp.]|uniref:nickel pincer cofactor biosynthesis protein LarB n=1 Tax=Brooklawnia sp. TaxID=2699740 RepID=UPI00311E4B2D